MLRKRLWCFLSMAVMPMVLMGCPDDSANNSNNVTSCTFSAECGEGQRCDNGKCSSETKSCTTLSDCTFDEYCAAGKCALDACSQDSDCVGDGVICRNDQCRVGCRTNEQCDDGQVCNSTFACEDAGCTPSSCSPVVESCDTDQSPSRCVPNGKCNVDIDCAVYANHVGDGQQRICGAAKECVVKPPCQSDMDCKRDEGEICEVRDNQPNACRKGCRDDAGCAANEFCDVDAARCVVGCASDADCSAIDPNKDFTCQDLKCIEICENADSCDINGQICAPKVSGGPRVCHGCSTDSQCAITQYCDKTMGSNEDERNDPSVGLCVELPPECPEDGYGDNHSLERAFAITTFPFDSDGTLAEGAATPNPLFCDENRLLGEWFKIQADAGKVITIKTTYTLGGANIDLELLRSDGVPLVASKRPPTVDGGVEEIVYGVSTGDNFLIKITGSLSGKTNLAYDLFVDVAAPAPCTDDMFEENDTLQTAATVMPGVPAMGLQVCSSFDMAHVDRDFYKLDAAANQIVTIFAENDATRGELEILVTDALGSSVPTQVVGNSVQFATEQAGTYIAEVAVASGVGNIDYDFEWRQRDNQCADAYEPNNASGTASVVAPGRLTGLNLCTDEDWYVIDLLPLQTITVNADYDPNQGQGFIDLRLRGPNDPALIAQYDTREILAGGIYRQKVTLQAQQGGKFYIAASLAQGLNVPYELDVQVQDGPPCVEDPYEQNDDLASATPIDATLASQGVGNALIGLRYCDLDNDYYAIDLAVGDEIRWEVKHTVANGDLDAEIIGPVDAMNMGPVVAVGTGTANDEVVSYTVPAGKAGRYALRVFGKNALRTDYRVLTYLNGTGPTDPNCPDLYENNDTRAEAKMMTPGSYSLLVCGQPLDDDWFTTCIQAGETLKVDLSLDHSRGNIDLYLYDDSGSAQFLAFSNTLTNAETVSYTTTRDQCLTYRVNTFTNVPSNVYTMDVNVLPAPVCPEDRFEPNNSAATATVAPIPGLLRGVFKCEDDDDWYSVQVTENQKAEIYVNFDIAAGDIDVEIYDSVGAAAPVFFGRATTAGEAVAFTAPDDAATTNVQPQTVRTYFVKVITKSRARLAYDLLTYLDTNNDGTVEGPEDRLCPDMYENNDLRTSAKPFPIGVQDDLSLCWQGGTLNDNDYYSVFVPAGATLNVDVRFAHDKGNLDIEVFRGSAGAAVAFSRSTTDDESATATNTGAGETYIIRVYGAGTARFTTTYELEVGLSFADMCDEDLVTGDDKAGAKTIATGSYPNLGLCEGTEDWMTFSATANQRILANVEVNNLFGDVDVQLLDSNDVVIAEAVASGASVETIDVTAPAAGTYYLRVFPKGGSFIRNYYDLWLQLGNTPPAAPFCPDAYERNDSATSAAILNYSTTPQYTDMIACGADQDWYAVNLNANTDYYAAVFFEQNAGQQLNVKVQNDAGTSIASSMATGNDEFLTFRPTATGTYYFGVENVAATPTQGSYYMFFNAKTAACKEDAYETNNSAAQAKALPVGPGVHALASCAGGNQDDYFVVTAANAGPITITVMHDSSVLGLSVEAVDLAEGRILFANTATPNRKIITKAAAQAGDQLRVYIGNGMGSGPYFMKIEN